MNSPQNHAFSRLMAAWNRREEARTGDIRDLAAARWELDAARTQMRSTLSSSLR